MGRTRTLGQVHMEAKDLAFVTAVLLGGVATMGIHFLVPVLVPLGRHIGADNQQIGFFGMARGCMMIVSTVWLSWVSDCTSRRTAVIVALAGSGVAYMLQAVAVEFVGREWRGVNLAVAVFALGRAVAGFFGGLTPVLLAFVSELHPREPIQQRRKMVMFQISQQAVGLGLAPISGSIARFSLVLPYWVATGINGLALLWAVLFFPSAKSGRRAQVIATDLPDPDKPHKSPYRDRSLGLLGAGALLVGLGFSGAELLLPNLLFARESYGLSQDGQSELQRAEAVSQALGLLILPFGLSHVFTTLIIFPIFAECCGESGKLFVVGLLSTAAWALHGLTTEIWQICILQAVLGAAFGIALPVIGPLMALYSEAIYPWQKGAALSVPMTGIAIGFALGMNVAACAEDQLGLQESFYLIAGIQVLAAFLLMGGTWDILSALQRHEASESQMPLEMTGVDEAEFTKSMVKLVRQRLSSHTSDLWSKPMQALVEAQLKHLIPDDVPQWDEDTNGQEHLDALWESLGKYPESRDEHKRLFRRTTTVKNIRARQSRSSVVRRSSWNSQSSF